MRAAPQLLLPYASARFVLRSFPHSTSHALADDKYAFFCIICTLGVGAWCVLCKARHKARERYDMSQEANCCSCSDKVSSA